MDNDAEGLSCNKRINRTNQNDPLQIPQSLYQKENKPNPYINFDFIISSILKYRGSGAFQIAYFLF